MRDGTAGWAATATAGLVVVAMTLGGCMSGGDSMMMKKDDGMMKKDDAMMEKK